MFKDERDFLLEGVGVVAAAGIFDVVGEETVGAVDAVASFKGCGIVTAVFEEVTGAMVLFGAGVDTVVLFADVAAGVAILV